MKCFFLIFFNFIEVIPPDDFKSRQVEIFITLDRFSLCNFSVAVYILHIFMIWLSSPLSTLVLYLCATANWKRSLLEINSKITIISSKTWRMYSFLIVYCENVCTWFLFESCDLISDAITKTSQHGYHALHWHSIIVGDPAES